MDAGVKKSSLVKSADRALDIVEYVAEAQRQPSFSEIMSDLDIPRSSLFHLLRNLTDRGYIGHDEKTGRYFVGDRIREIAQRPDSRALDALVLPYLRNLSREVNETAGFYCRYGDEVETIASVTGGNALVYTMRTGERAPLYAVSAGKVALSTDTPEELEKYLERVVLEKITAHTLSSKNAVRAEIERARDEDFAYVHEEFTPGITGIATKVVVDGRFVGAINLAVPTARFTPERKLVFQRLLTTASHQISKAAAAQTTFGHGREGHETIGPGKEGR